MTKLFHYHSFLKPIFLIFSGIILLGSTIRLYKLTDVPPALHGDESGTGYNAYSLLTVGKDEYGKSWPLTFRNDFSPLIFYLTLPSVSIWGLTEFATRFPSVIAGILLSFLTYLVINTLFGKRKLALLTCLLISFSTWQLRSSRLGLEMIWALVFQFLGIYLLLTATPFNKKKLLFAFIGFGLSLFAYQSAKMTTPLLLITILFLYYRKLLTRRRILYIACLFAIFIMSPMVIYFLVRPINEMRFIGISVFTLWHAQLIQSHISIFSVSAIWELIKMVLLSYFQHFDLRILFLDNSQLRYFQLDRLGLFYPWQSIFMILGIYYLIRHLRRSEYKFLFIWLIIAPMPAALTNTPFANIGRALLLYPALEVICALGILYTLTLLYQRFRQFYGGFIILLILITGSFYYLFLNSYFNLMPKNYSQAWGVPFKKVVPYIIKNEATYDKIIISNSNRQSYMYLLFYGQKSPDWLLKQEKVRDPVVGYSKIFKYEFRRIDWSNDKYLVNTLLVGTPEELPDTGNPALFEFEHPLSHQVLLRAVRT